jgi:uncharacterized membrane protein
VAYFLGLRQRAICVLFRSVTEDKVIAELEPYKPRVLKTSLSNERDGQRSRRFGERAWQREDARANDPAHSQ